MRPAKVPRIYPLVACPSAPSTCCEQDSSTFEPSAPPSDNWAGRRRWQVIRVSRSEQRNDVDSNPNLEKVAETTDASQGDTANSVRLLIEALDQNQFEDSSERRRKPARNTRKKSCACGYVCPLMKIPEHQEVAFAAKPKQVRFNTLTTTRRTK
ncbi:hypothetical protein Q1695_008226 [Nippostrongylus brasiliensis]|nr:hypothetical protein Q1695_008226 [Nippostrongylus brasiliensis]